MKKTASIILSLLFIPSFVGAQVNVYQGGTGLTSVPTNAFVVGSSALRLAASSTPFFSNFTFINATGTNATTTNLFSTNAVFGSATTTSFAVTGISSALVATGATGGFVSYAGTSCTNQFVRSLSILGAATCATVSASDVSLANLTATDSTLTFSGTYNGSTARTIGINLGNANTWTALQTFSNANSILATGSTTLQNFTGINGTTTNATTTNFYVSGQQVNISSTYVGVISALRQFGGQTGTTTTWTASTSRAYEWYAPMPFSGTLRTVTCSATTTQAFLGISPYVNALRTSPSYFVASTTEGVITFTGNNTFVRGDVVGFTAGTTTTDTNAYSVSCTFSATETP